MQTFDQKELYLTPIEKPAAVLGSIVVNHPFIDGNKRTGYVLMTMILLEAGIDINASQKEKYDLVIGLAKGELDHSKIAQLIREKIK
ncbi:MAG: type II toxin-antitoxin system death-on-curing family toxin [Saprospiraceae bacterium]